MGKKAKEMKPIVLILSLIIIVLVTFMTLNFIEDRKEDSLKQSTINGLRLQNKKEKDSLENVLKVTRDSLDIAFNTIKIATAEREASHLRTQATIRNLQRIVFITHSDSSRTKALKELYKTYTP